MRDLMASTQDKHWITFGYLVIKGALVILSSFFMDFPYFDRSITNCSTKLRFQGVTEKVNLFNYANKCVTDTYYKVSDTFGSRLSLILNNIMQDNCYKMGAISEVLIKFYIDLYLTRLLVSFTFLDLDLLHPDSVAGLLPNFESLPVLAPVLARVSPWRYW